MIEGLLQPLHLLAILFCAAIFLAGFFLGRYVEIKKSKRP